MELLSKRGRGEKVALDTNMLTAISQFKVDVLDGIEEVLGKSFLVVPKQVVSELEVMVEKGGKLGKAGRMALEIIAEKEIGQIEVEAEDADSALLKLSKQGFKIATNDKELRKAVKKSSGHVIYIRQKKKLELD